MNSTPKTPRKSTSTKRDPLATLRARGLVTPPRSSQRDTSMPTIKAKGGPIADLVSELRG